MSEQDEEQTREEIREKIKEREKDFVGKPDTPEEKKDRDDINSGSQTPGPPPGIPR